MTYEIVCSKCGCVLYSGLDLRSPGEVIRQYGGRCKKCQVTLVAERFGIEVEKFAGSFVASQPGRSTISISLRGSVPVARPQLRNEAAA